MDVDLWWARADLHQGWHVDLLDAAERGRREALRRPEDRARFTVATATLKLVVARRYGVPARQVAVARACPDCGRPHGAPRLPDHPLSVSISHSGDWAVVAVATAPAVGVDVEQVVPVDLAGLGRQVLAAGEEAATPAAFFRYWTRKESVLKATGDGLRVALTRVGVTPADQPPRLLRYDGRPGLTAAMADVDPADGYAAAVTVLGHRRVRVRTHDAAPLLRRARPPRPPVRTTEYPGTDWRA